MATNCHSMEMFARCSFTVIIIITAMTSLRCNEINLQFDYNNVSSIVDNYQRETAAKNKHYVLRHAPDGVVVHPNFNPVLSCVLDLLHHWDRDKIVLFTDDIYFASGSSRINVEEWFQSKGIHLTSKIITSLNEDEMKNVTEILTYNKDFLIISQTNLSVELIKMGEQKIRYPKYKSWIIVDSKKLEIFENLRPRMDQFILISHTNLGKSYEDLVTSEIRINNIFFSSKTNRWAMTTFATWSSIKGLNLFSDFDKDEAETKMNGQNILIVAVDMWPGEMEYRFGALARHLNFTIKYTGPFDGSYTYGEEINGTFTGAIGTLQAREADFSSAPIYIQQNRAKVIRYVAPFFSNTLKLWYKPASPKVSLIAHLRAFSWPTWITAFVTVITTVGILAFAFYKLNTVMYGESLQLKKWIFTGEMVIDSLNKVPGLSNKLLTGIFYVWVLIMFTHYSSVLKSFLIYKHQEVLFKNLEDVAKRDDYNVLVMKGAVLYNYFMISDDDLHREINRLINRNPAKTLFHYHSSIASLCNEKSVQIEMSREIDIILGGGTHMPVRAPVPLPCDLVNIPQDFKMWRFYTFRKDFPFENIFRIRMLKMFEAGIFIREVQGQIFKPPDANADKLMLTAFHVIVPIMIITVGVIISLFLLFVELCSNRKQWLKVR